jgi:antitoxin YefM
MKGMNVKLSIFVPCWYTQKLKDMLVISSREFRQNQKLYFERADKGEQIIVQRGTNKSYALTPINEDDVYFSAEMIQKIKLSAEEAKNGDVKRITSSAEINDLLGL